jgi:transcription elongation factor Elf1
MSLWLEKRYVSLLSFRLRNFKHRSGNLYNFSCPICDDSSRSRSRARGYLYERDGRLQYHCHNCGVTMWFPRLLSRVDPSIYDDYLLELIDERGETRLRDPDADLAIKFTPPAFDGNPLRGLKRVSQLDDDDPVRRLVLSRCIPRQYHDALYSCPNYMRHVNSLIPDKFSERALSMDSTRLLIPFRDADGRVYAMQGRALGESDVKYITVVLETGRPAIWGLDRVDWSHTVWAFEGPIDAMFIPNSIATAGGEMTSVVMDYSDRDLVVVYDNEPRSPHTRGKLERAITAGYRVVIWPKSMPYKDVNDMVLAGNEPDYIVDLMRDRTFSGLSARLELAEWSLA